MTNQQIATQENRSRRSKWVIGLVVVAVAGFAACAMMKTLVRGKVSKGCPCNNQPEESCQAQDETPPVA